MSELHLQPYPAYRPSGLDWLPEIPAHWRTERGKWLLKKMSRPVRDTDEVVTCFRDGVVTLRKNRRTEGFTESLQEIGYQGIRAGDLVIHAMDAFAGAIGVSDSDGKGTPVYSVCRPASTANAHFYAYILREMARNQWIAALATGIRERSTDFRYATLASQQLPLPPLPEQRAIARYLDHVNRRIQRYIDTKEKLIALLQEARQATIHRAVTRGLDPDVPLKPSGVEWLEDVPEHWEMRRLKTLCAMKSGDWIDSVSIEPIGEFPVYGGNGLRGFTSTYNHDGAFTLIGRQGALCGNVHIARGKFWATEHAVVTTLDSGHNVVWFGAILTAMDLNQYSNAAAQPGLSVERILNLYLPVPPSSEQELIAAYLDQTTADIDAAIESARRQADLMRDYRASLIAHVVTGKLDVRAVAERIGMETSHQ